MHRFAQLPSKPAKKLHNTHYSAANSRKNSSGSNNPEYKNYLFDGPSHVGIRANEEADDAISSAITNVISTIPHEDLYSIIRPKLMKSSTVNGRM